MGQTEAESFEILNLVRILIAMLKANGKLIAKMGEVEKRFLRISGSSLEESCSGKEVKSPFF